jgi:hypothetical protein
MSQPADYHLNSSIFKIKSLLFGCLINNSLSENVLVYLAGTTKALTDVGMPFAYLCSWCGISLASQCMNLGTGQRSS